MRGAFRAKLGANLEESQTNWDQPMDKAREKAPELLERITHCTYMAKSKNKS